MTCIYDTSDMVFDVVEEVTGDEGHHSVMSLQWENYRKKKRALRILTKSWSQTNQHETRKQTLTI